MCGIAGFFSRSSGPSLEEALTAALRSLSHRGPDDEGHALLRSAAGTVGLGHRRLSIRDLSRAGRQPFSKDGCLLVANGEIYNADELRRSLQDAGHRFRSGSDSEVILHGYLEHGIGILERLNGMFAFGLWDGRRRRLLLARDRLGIKPLLYGVTSSGLAFASELRTLLEWPGISRRLDPQALHQYLMLGYTLAPVTIVQGIQKLEPGHYLLFDAADGSLTRKQYWSLENAFREPCAEVGSDADEKLWHRLSASVAERTIADVPVGTFLSGGVDSSVISALLGRRAPRSKSFCCDFREETFSEGEQAARSARSLGLDHQRKLLEPPRPEQMPALVRAADEPFADTSFVPCYRLSAFARQQVTVILSGDGADELLAGYATYQADGVHSLTRRLPLRLRNWLAGPLANRVQADSRKVGLRFKARQFLSAAASSAPRAHALWRCLWWPQELERLLGADLRRELERAGSDPLRPIEERFDRVRDLPFLQQSLYADLCTWLPDDILHKVDRASMAHGLEVRVPFLDHRFVAWCAGLPPRLKLRGATGKWILRRAAGRFCPELQLQRRKLGFNAPVGQWLNGSLAGWADELVDASTELAGDWLGDPGVLGEYLDQHRRGAADHSFRLWGLFWLLEWIRQTDTTLSAEFPAAAASAVS